MVLHKRLKVRVVFVALCLFALIPAAGNGTAQDSVATENGCMSCHQKVGDKSVELYLRSTHAASNLTCNRCHGGDLFASEKQQAHSGRFIGQPRPDQLIAMCGSCHKPQLEMFKSGRHSPEHKGQARIDCVQCHGAHTVGAPAESFSFAYLCAGCHGLEYLPPLPQDFQKLMALADDVQGELRTFRKSGLRLNDEASKLRKDIRRFISEIVHPTDLQGGQSRIPNILRTGDEFKRAVDRQKRPDSKGD